MVIIQISCAIYLTIILKAPNIKEGKISEQTFQTTAGVSRRQSNGSFHTLLVGVSVGSNILNRSMASLREVEHVLS